jgi:hypothetical protein
MSTLNKVFAKFSAQEPNKVELSSISEMNKIASQAAELQKKAYPMINALNEIDFVVNRATQLISEANKLYQNGSSTGTAFASQVEDLGMNPRQNKNYTDMFDAMNDMAQVIMGLETLAKKYR